MRFVSVSGAKGSGKTTLIRELIARLATRGFQAAVVVNEEGQAAYDADFIERHKLPVKQIRGG